MIGGPHTKVANGAGSDAIATTDETPVVLVTGGGGAGCGRAISTRFASSGASVVVGDVDEASGRQTVDLVERNGGRAMFFRVDVRDEAQVKALVDFAQTTFGRVDVLVNNASAPHGGPHLESWMDALQTDLLGAFYATRYAVDLMRRAHRGSIVNIASISALWHGRTTPGGIPGYDVAKAAMIRMTTRLASLATDGIRVNCLAPGWIATTPVREYWQSLTPAERKERGVPSTLLTTEQVADAVVRVANDRSLAGRVLVWWSEDIPRLIEWGDRGYEGTVEF